MMNERIMQIVAKANMEVMEKYGQIDPNALAVAFAENVVKDCAYLVNDYQRTTGYTDYAKMLCKTYGIEFKPEDYFGDKK